VVTTQLERQFIHLLGAKYAISFSYGRVALYAILKALDVAGKEVIIPAFCCTVVRDAIAWAGGKPVFVRINPKTFALDINNLTQSISSKTAAIIVIHYWGQVCPNFEEVLVLAKESKIDLIENAAHAFGAFYKGKMIGTFGRVAIFSLTKGFFNLGGGIAVTDDTDIAKRLYLIRSNKVANAYHSLLFKRAYDMWTFYKSVVNILIYDRVSNFILKKLFVDGPRKLLRGLSASKNHNYNCEYDTFCLSELKTGKLIDALALYQLKNFQRYVVKRVKIGQRLISELPDFCMDWTKYVVPGSHTFTYFPLFFKSGNLKAIIQQALRKGVMLRETWPAVQNYWDSQNTPDIQWIKNHVLIWQVTPLVTDKEVNKFISIIKGLG